MRRWIEQRSPRQRADAADLQRSRQPLSRPLQESERVARLQRLIGNQASGLTRAAEEEGAPEPDDTYRHTQRAGEIPEAGPAVSPADAGSAAATASASLTITGDGSYADTATESRKNVRFNATWSGGSKEDYIMVNWVKGYMKKADGTFFRAKLYDADADINFADYQVDSPDKDPAYWSKGGVRWRYNVDGANKFSATDSPGPMFDTDGAGAKARLDFKTAVYKSSDVPSTTSGSLAATPLSTFETWTYHVNVLGGGKFDHK